MMFGLALDSPQRRFDKSLERYDMLYLLRTTCVARIVEMAMEMHTNVTRSRYHMSEWLALVVFTTEAGLRIVAQGFVVGNNTYRLHTMYMS